MLQPLLSDKVYLSTTEQQELQRIENLTPGDFAVARDKYAFADEMEITHRQLINSLINEVRYKKQQRPIIGFNLNYI
jgi:hypothetical protein